MKWNSFTFCGIIKHDKSLAFSTIYKSFRVSIFTGPGQPYKKFLPLDHV